MSVLKLLPPLYIHPVLGFFILISILTGTFVELSFIFLIVMFHEFGHYVVARYFRWRIRRINLWIFGGVMETEEHTSKPMKQELLITLAGPVQHIWIHFLLLYCAGTGFLSPSITELALQFNITILIFNLLPIWPLDGGKLLMLFLSSFLPYKTAHSAMIICSVLCLLCTTSLFFLFYTYSMSTLLLLGFILWENRLEWKRRYYTFIRFLLNRQIYLKEIKRVSPIVVHPDLPLRKVFAYFRRNYRHDIHVKDNWNSRSLKIDEEDCLRTYFRLKQYEITVGEMTRLRY
ncbi:M50 family metallopeptidase [Aquibacillus albus]|uniref:Stage IV sporulation protein FB n=1 Tax=Aquibacillus albus TaxID=1168171 RepID=A0ABS2N1L9_9BACI|nr:M50 family metallopeptidase [Aquibacillus albus]MBM7572034.1 stage IV sporulation protein FB [Aquibacillus albus]